MKLILPLLLLSLSSCGYNWGHKGRQLPGGHKTVYIETFKNRSEDVGAEAAFTKALMRELERSGFAIVTSKNAAELMITGEIISTNVVSAGSEPGFVSQNYVSDTDTVQDETLNTHTNYNASFFTIFILSATANIRAVRLRDQQVLWRTNISGSRTYRGSRLKKQGLRSSNVLYNHSRRKQTMELIANNMMSEAFDRLTENF